MTKLNIIDTNISLKKTLLLYSLVINIKSTGYFLLFTSNQHFVIMKLISMLVILCQLAY